MVMELAHQSWRAMRRPACIYKHRGVTPELRRAGGALGKRLAYLRRGLNVNRHQWHPEAMGNPSKHWAYGHTRTGALHTRGRRAVDVNKTML